MLFVTQLTGLVLIALINGEVGGDCPPELNDLELSSSELVVQYGQPANATCYSPSNYTDLYWSVSPGNAADPDTQTVTWETDNLTDWEIQLVCYMTLDDGQCSKTLPLTIYKLPDQVSISTVNHTGPMIKGRQYELQCNIQDVAPVHLLTVKWYKGNDLVKTTNFPDSSTKKPENRSTTLQITPSREDYEKIQYRCEAELKLGQEVPPKVASDPLTITTQFNQCADLELNPPELVVRYGDPASVSCRSFSNNTDLGWSVSMGNVSRPDNENVTWKTDSLTDWEIQPVCYRAPDDGQCSRGLSLIVYKLPDQVSISIVDHTGPMTIGKKYDLQCDIQNFAPVNVLSVSWYKGDTLMKSRGFNDLPTKIPSNKTVTLKITPNTDDVDAQYRCEARLKLGGSQPAPVVKSNLLDINVHYKPVINCSAWSPMINTTLNTYASNVMGNPSPTINWYRDKTPVSSDMRLGRDDSGQYKCVAANEKGSTSCVVKITVEYAPTFECPVSYEAIEHDSFLGKCSVMASPRATVTWEKDGRTVNPLHHLTSGDSGSYVITAVNKHGTETHNLIINVLCDCCIKLQPDKLVVEFGASATAICSATTAHLGMGWEASQGPVEMVEHVQFITWRVESLTHWDIKPICYINTHKQCELSLPVTIYKRPDQVSISTVNHTGPMIEGRQYELQCDVQNVAPVHLLTVNWYKGQQLVKRQSFSNETLIQLPVNKTTTLQISTSKDDDGVQYRCEAELNLGPEGPQPPPVVTSYPLDITVHYRPIITCSAWSPMINTTLNTYAPNVMGNPSPTISWYRDKTPVSSDTRLGRDDSGQYEYVASNALGSTSCVVKITVEYAPTFECPVSYEGIEHDSFLGKCSVRASPRATVTWEKDGRTVNPIHHLTRGDSGSYVITAVNKHGTETHNLIINVLYKPNITCSDWSPLNNTALNSYPYNVMGNPSPIISWYRDKSPISSNTRLGKDNSGQYEYVASNVMGNASCVIKIRVEYAPTFECPVSYEANEHDSFIGKCSVRASPRAIVTWEKDGRTVNPLRNLTRKDNGSYVITAVNKHGTEKHNLIINVLYPPEIHHGFTTDVVRIGKDMFLNCTADGNPVPKVEWKFKNQTKATGRRHTMLNVSEASSADAGDYTCTATNEHGNATRTVSVKVAESNIRTIIICLGILLALLIIIIYIIYKVVENRRSGKYDIQANGAVGIALLNQNEGNDTTTDTKK